MQFDILTLFPQMFDAYFQESILGRAQKEGKISVQAHQLRDWSTDEKHRRVDDTPYGGGAGMVLMVEPVFRAMEALKKCNSTSPRPLLSSGEGENANAEDLDLSDPLSLDKETSPTESFWRGVGVRFDFEGDMQMQTRTILFSAKGKRFTQEDARRLTQYDRLILVCGRYEGVDERVAEHVVDEELSIGDFVLTGGELPAMVVVDAVARLLPEVLGNAESAVTESHTEAGVLEHPQYTKPEEFNGWRVPEVLLSGHHENVDHWREEHSGKVEV